MQFHLINSKLLLSELEVLNEHIVNGLVLDMLVRLPGNAGGTDVNGREL